mmetsp:Transcript_98265/g.262565  ORF Transcript_98265/g.262565 Transcript_98265/m.262565 type:complete len:226 (-) Transcript_98265:780-1457(-)
MGIITDLLFTSPAENAEKPAMAPCTAVWASRMQYSLSSALAGTERIMYDGSMYLTLASRPCALKSLVIASFNHFPMSLYRLLPLSSVPSPAPVRSCPAPSATTTTAELFRLTTERRCLKIDFGPSVTMGTSGTKHRSTSLAASVAWVAINPESRPISFTTHTPFGAEAASIRAHSITLHASSIHVLKPNERSITPMSLSMVFGTPMIAIFFPRRMASSCSLYAPR